jgi:hypothetical protein
MYDRLDERLGIRACYANHDQSAPGGLMGWKTHPRTEYAGKLIGATRGVDGIQLFTHCHYSTPFEVFTVELPGWVGCEPTSPVPKK